ncbi:MAG: di-heme oxidoredictase family protein [Blastocatellia bacterium]
MTTKKKMGLSLFVAFLGAFALMSSSTRAQLPDRTQNPNTARAGINKSLTQQIGAGRGDRITPNSSAFIIARDPFRAIRRGRQLFQRKFLRVQGQGPLAFDAVGDLEANFAIGAGMTDSCAACHGRPRGSAGFGGDVATRPDSRDAPHLFGLGLKEMLADEITADLRAIRNQAIADARAKHRSVTKPLTGKGINYGAITAHEDGSVDTSLVEGVDSDLRVRPFFAHGGTISIREFVIGAFNDEMGLQAVDPDVAKAAAGERIVTPSGMVLDGATDQIKPTPADNATADPDADGVTNEIPSSLVDFMEFYLLNYFKPAIAEQTSNAGTASIFFPRAGCDDQSASAIQGRAVFQNMGCAVCHIPDLTINRDRRVADVDTVFDPARGIFNRLFSTAVPLFAEANDGSGLPSLKQPKLEPFVVKSIFTDFKRHDLGPDFHEIIYDGKVRTEFLTMALWGVGTTAPYGHDGRSVTLTEVILRHGGEAQASRNAFAVLSPGRRRDLLDFLGSLVIFPPDDTASNLDPGNRNTLGFPQFGHGSIKLTVLFNDPTDVE